MASVKIELKMDDQNRKILRFSHNGRPFNLQDLTRIVIQTSMKERPNPEEFKGETDEAKRRLELYILGDDLQIRTIGRFGTGFITVHLLSLHIDIEGTVDVSEDPQTQRFKQFKIRLDRTNVEHIARMTECAR